MTVGAAAVHDHSYLYSMYDFTNRGQGTCELGKGKHGKVRLAYDPQHQCEVAVKSQSCWTNLASREEMLLRALQDKNLPHVLRLFDVAQTRWERHMVMERADALAGPKLDRYTYASRCFKGPRFAIKVPELNLQVATSITAEVIRGLIELHSVGVYHRDVKLQNFSKNNKLLDYGKCAPSTALFKQVFEWSDVRGVCIMFADMLERISTDQAAAFRHWYKGAGLTQVEELRSYPLLCGEFGLEPCSTDIPCLPYIWNRSLWALLCAVNWATARAPLAGAPALLPPALPKKPA